ncbi:MAG TPA: hypothetical protein VGZ02_16725 [Candidatus Baltobacteraceae bacterium]|jgi:hypothetical protein|nr:hypothetical protein [Candidatus Baltobacteraceae bacterium]
MDNWITAAVQQRREELLAQAAHARTLRKLEGGRSSTIRGRIARTAQTLSAALAAFAQKLDERNSHGADCEDYGRSSRRSA